MVRAGAGGRRAIGGAHAGRGRRWSMSRSEVLGRLWPRERPFERLADVDGAGAAHGRALVSVAARRLGPGDGGDRRARAPAPGLADGGGGVAARLSRVAAGLHYPSDVLAGALLGRLVGRLLRD